MRACIFVLFAISLAAAMPLRRYEPHQVQRRSRSLGLGTNGGKNAGVYIDELYCTLSSKVNESSWKSFHDEVQSIWGPFCGVNRGVFVIKPADGKTYNCGKMPASWGINGVADIVGLDGKKGPEVLGKYLSAVFNTSTVIGPDSCDFNGLGHLNCNREQPWKSAPWRHLLRTDAPLRAVNIGGLFVLEPWITPEFAKWNNKMPDQYTYSQFAKSDPSMVTALENHWDSFYSDADFADMVNSNLNAIRLPVGWWYWAESAGVSPSPYIVPKQSIDDLNHPITRIIKMAQDHRLMVIIDLHGAPGSQNGLDNSGQRSMDPQVENWGDTWLYSDQDKKDTTLILEAITRYINALNQQGITNVIMLELVNEPWVFGDMSRVRDWYEATIPAVRAINSSLPIMIHDAFRHSEWTWLLHNWSFDNVYMDTHIYHAFNYADYASSTAECDKSKMVAHENMACRYGSMLRFKTCVSIPTFVGEWSLATDNCMGFLQGAVTEATQFLDYGQCDNLAARAGDKFWIEHTKSFAMRQIATFEDELGWAFWTYKLSPKGEQDISAPYWCFRLAVKAGFIDTNYPTNYCEHNVPQLDGC